MRTIITHALSAVLLGMPLIASAGLGNPLGEGTDLTAFLEKILALVVTIMFPIITLFIVYVGFLFVSSSGDPKKIQKAREYFFWAVIGALIVLGAQALSMAIRATVDDLKSGI